MPAKLPWGEQDSVPIYLPETHREIQGSLRDIRQRVRLVGTEASLLVLMTNPRDATRLLMTTHPTTAARLIDVSARDTLRRRLTPTKLAAELAQPYWVKRAEHEPYALRPYLRVEVGRASKLGETTKYAGIVVHPFIISSQAIIRQHGTVATLPDDFVSQARSNPSDYHPSAAYETELVIAAYKARHPY